MTQPPSVVLVLVTVLLVLAHHSAGTKPVLDLSNNMRHVLIPSDTRPGTVIYRLRASDADDDYPLSFKMHGRPTIVLIG